MAEEKAIEEATSEVKEAKKAKFKQRRADSQQQGQRKDRLGADKDYLSRLITVITPMCPEKKADESISIKPSIFCNMFPD